MYVGHVQVERVIYVDICNVHVLTRILKGVLKLVSLIDLHQYWFDFWRENRFWRQNLTQNLTNDVMRDDTTCLIESDILQEKGSSSLCLLILTKPLKWLWSSK